MIAVLLCSSYYHPPADIAAADKPAGIASFARPVYFNGINVMWPRVLLHDLAVYDKLKIAMNPSRCGRFGQAGGYVALISFFRTI